MNILITGGAGYVGSHMVHMLLSKRKYSPIVFDNLSTGHREFIPKGVIFIKGDLRRQADIRKVFNRYRIDAVMHFAASSIVTESMQEPLKYYENNVCGSINLIDLMLKFKVGKLIFSSTAAVYGQPRRIPISEENEAYPINPYGLSKLIIENMLKGIADNENLSYISLRYFNAAGANPSMRIGEWRNPETHLISNVLKVAIGKERCLTIFGDDYPTPDGTCVRDYIHVQDLCVAHLLALEKLNQGATSDIFNLGSNNGYSVKEVVKTAEKITGKRIKIKIGPRRPGDPAKLIASSDKAKRILGWRGKATLADIIKSAWEWEQKREVKN